LLLATITGLARALPLPIGHRAADLASEAHRWLAPARRRAVGENLDHLTGGRIPPGAVRQVFRNHGRSLLELLRGPEVSGPPARFEGWDHLETALGRGRGAVVCLPHTGSWQVSGAQVAGRGVPLSAVANTQLTRGWTPELRRRQEAAGIRILAPGVSSWRKMIRLLRRNEVLALLVDGDVFHGGIPVELAGRRVLFPAGPARLAGKTGAALLPAFGRRNEDGSLVFTFLAEVAAGPEAAHDPAPAMREIARRLEGPLREDPGQWMIFRRFFAGSGSPAAATPAGVGPRPAGSTA